MEKQTTASTIQPARRRTVTSRGQRVAVPDSAGNELAQNKSANKIKPDSKPDAGDSTTNKGGKQS